MRSISIVILFASLAWAQDPSTPEGRDERVQVQLKNGHSMIGIAKAGVRCERLVRGNFKPAGDAPDRSSGIRVWYYQDLDGYIFLEQKGLERVDVLGTLSHEESRALSDAISAARGARIQVASAAASRPSPSSSKKDGETASESRPAPKDGNGYTAHERALLDRFPPDKGWNPEKFGELQRRKIVLHVNPSAEEQAFVDEFPTFQDAWKKWLTMQPKMDEAPKSEEAPKPERKK
jgi:hypothetical protein